MSFNPQPIRDRYPDDPLVDELLRYLEEVAPILHALDTIHFSLAGWFVRGANVSVVAEANNAIHGELIFQMMRKEIVR